MTRRLVAVVLVLGAALGAAACSGTSDDALHQSLTPLPRGLSSTTTTTTTPPQATTTTLADTSCGPTNSFRPDPTAPAPSVAAIKTRGHLVIGVDQGTPGWGFRDPRNGVLDGLEVQLLHRIARAIFGDDGQNRVLIKTLTTAQRISAVHDGKVDMVASLLTATCERWKQVDFSTVYYEAHQALLVNSNSTITSTADLAGRRVCATRGSTSIQNIAAKAPKAILYPVDARSDCVVALQEGDVDAITSDDTILRSFQQQEHPGLTKVIDLPDIAEPEPYAIAIQKGKEDLVRFVNGVLDQMRSDGSLEQLYVDWLHGNAPATVPTAGYR